MHTLLLGGKEQERLNALFSQLSPVLGDKPIIVLCPEQYTVEMERLFIEGLQLKGLLHVEVLSFKRLLHKIDKKTPGPSKTVMDDTGRIMLLRKALYAERETLQYFAPLVNQGGFLKACLQGIGFFKQSRISGDQLLQCSESFDHGGLLHVKLKEFAGILKSYEQEMTQSHYDVESHFEEMTRRLEKSTLFSDVCLCVVGFTSFNKLELNLLKAMMMRVKQVHIELDLQRAETGPIEAYRLLNKTYHQIKGLIGTDQLVEHWLEQSDLNDLSYLARYYDVYPTEPFKGLSKSIRLRAAINAEEEVEGVAVDILRRQQKSGCRFKSFALLMEDVALYAPVVERVFSEYDIPYFLDMKRSVLGRSLPSFLISLLRVVEFGFSRVDVMEHMKTGYYPIDSETIGKFEAIAISEGLSGSDLIHLDSDDLMIKEEVREIWEQVLLPLVDFYHRYSKAGDIAAERIDCLMDYFEDRHITETQAQKISWLKQHGELRLAYEEAQLFNEVLNVLDQQKNLLGDLPFESKDYLDMLKVGLSQLEVGTIPTQRDYVLVGDLERSRLSEIDELYILGANEGVIPPVLKAQDVFLEAEKEKLKALGLDLEGLTEDLDIQASYNLVKAITKPKVGLTVSFTFSDASGVAQKKSFLIERIQALFKTTEIIRFQPETINQTLKLRLRPALRQGLNGIRKRFETQSLTQTDFDFMAYMAERPQTAQLMAYQRDVLLGYLPQDKLTERDVEALYPQPLVASPTRLERFIRCPFQHFAHYGLAPVLIGENELEALEIGNYQHVILDRFSQYLRESNKSWLTIHSQDIETWLAGDETQFLTHKLKRLIKKKKSLAHTIKRLNQVGLRALKTAKKQFELGRFHQVASELSITRQIQGASLPPIELTLSDGKKVLLEGKIDRVDIADVNGQYYARVIDYKTGNKQFDLNDVYWGTALQLTLYMGALVESSKTAFGEHYKPAGIYYSRVDDPMIHVEANSQPDFEAVEELIFSALKLSGITVDTLPVLEAMDRGLFQNGKSGYLPVEMTAKSTETSPDFTKASALLSEPDFDTVLSACKTRAKRVSESIYKGEVVASPLLDNQILSCEYCPYKALCGYDKRDPNCSVRRFKRNDKQTILERMRREG